MVDDIVKRLRQSDGFKVFRAEDGFNSICADTDLLRAAADEIERLRDLICDGHGSYWPMCDRPDCELHVVRPGVARCYRCEDEEKAADGAR